MSISVVSVHSVLSQYQRALKHREAQSTAARGAERSDKVDISTEARDAGLVDRIGEAAVRAFRDQSVDELNKKSS